MSGSMKLNKEEMLMDKKMPVLFIGHGSPMNAIEDNSYVRTWKEIAEKIPRPEAILCISAHWVTNGTRINDQENPKIVYDMYGFPQELYNVKYDVHGSNKLAHETIGCINRAVKIDNSWGVDHGAWSVLCKMYPEADIPVYQLSLDINSSAEAHFKIGKDIGVLREKGVLIIGSGNIVHNLSRVKWGMEGGYPWALEFDNFIMDNIKNKRYENVVHYENAGNSSKLAFLTTEHFYPLLYVLGAAREDDKLSVFNNSCTMGSLSMTCYLFEE